MKKKNEFKIATSLIASNLFETNREKVLLESTSNLNNIAGVVLTSQ